MSQYFEATSDILLYFNHEFYVDGIIALRTVLSKSIQLQQQWLTAKQAINEQLFEQGEPLMLIHHKANQVLDENTDEEAYKWLELMIQNIERNDGQIIEY